MLRPVRRPRGSETRSARRQDRGDPASLRGAPAPLCVVGGIFQLSVGSRGSRLESHGLRRAERLPGMAADLRALNGDIPFPTGLTVERVGDAEVLSEYVEVARAGIGMPGFVTGAFLEACSVLGLAEDNPFGHYVGRRGGARHGPARSRRGCGDLQRRHPARSEEAGDGRGPDAGGAARRPRAGIPHRHPAVLGRGRLPSPGLRAVQHLPRVRGDRTRVETQGAPPDARYVQRRPRRDVVPWGFLPIQATNFWMSGWDLRASMVL